MTARLQRLAEKHFVLNKHSWLPLLEACGAASEFSVNSLKAYFIKGKLRGPGKMWGLTFKLVKMFQLCHNTELVSVVVTVVSHCNLCFPSEIIKCPFSFVCHMPDAHVSWEYMKWWSNGCLDTTQNDSSTLGRRPQSCLQLILSSAACGENGLKERKCEGDSVHDISAKVFIYV